LERSAGGEGIVGGVHAHGLEHLGVLGEAVLLEAGLGELPTVEVARFVVNGPKPTGVLPGRGAEVDPVAGESSELVAQLDLVEWCRFHGRSLRSAPTQSEARRGAQQFGRHGRHRPPGSSHAAHTRQAIGEQRWTALTSGGTRRGDEMSSTLLILESSREKSRDEFLDTMRYVKTARDAGFQV
jgi:hypothetical protein